MQQQLRTKTRWLAGGYNVDCIEMSGIEVFDPLVGSWQEAGDLTRRRHSRIALFAIKDDLFAAGGTHKDDRFNVGGSHIENMWIEKRDGQTGAWQLVSQLEDGERFECALAACGSTIYFLGGRLGSSTTTSWNSFDTRTNMWASQQEEYQDVALRQLPRAFSHRQAVCITPIEARGLEHVDELSRFRALRRERSGRSKRLYTLCVDVDFG